MSSVRGFKAARARARRRPSILEAQARDGLAETVKAVRAKGAENIRAMTTRRTGTLVRFYRSSVSRSALEGRVGYLSRRAKAEAFYARFIHDGTRYLLARPFHTIAVEETELLHGQRMREALRRANRGGRS